MLNQAAALYPAKPVDRAKLISAIATAHSLVRTPA
jgi:hypothetical protein